VIDFFTELQFFLATKDIILDLSKWCCEARQPAVDEILKLILFKSLAADRCTINMIHTEMESFMFDTFTN
jgi:hypothetical protein